MPNLEYIASGTSYFRINAPRNIEGEGLKILNRFLSSISKNTDHKFGILYNAYAESKFGEYQNLHRNALSSIHADSGGLQILTQSIESTPELRDRVYENQGTWSDFAMAFDESPVVMSGTSSSRTSTSDRMFCLDSFDAAAKSTGENVLRQIEKFISMDSKSKPIIIAHGNGYDTYMRWVEILMNQIPQDLHSCIKGVAMGGTAMGYGIMEDTHKAFYFKQLPIDTNHLHVLGVGSIKRIFPYLALSKSGYYDKDLNISYDSTTHTSGVEFGHFFKSNGMLEKIKRSYSKGYERIYNDINEIFNIKSYDDRMFFDIMNNGYTKCVEDLGYSNKDFSVVRNSYICKSIINFCRVVDKIMVDDQFMSDQATKNKIFSPMMSLMNVKSQEDFNLWDSHARKDLRSKKVKTKPNTLEEFF